jgi:hypothetical protein
MRSLFNKIIKVLNFGGRNWVVFLLALLLSFSIWIIHKLSLEYNVYLKVNVVASSNIKGYSKYSTSSTEVMAKCRASGWRILYSKIIDDEAVYVDFPSTVLQKESDESYYITSEKLHEFADKIFGSSVSVEYFVTDRTYFTFQEEVYKEVPIRPVSSLSFEEQYMSSGPLVLNPSTVTVYGDPMHLEALEYVTTDIIKKIDINEDFSGMISLTPISGMRFSVDEVHYKMDVSRYLEIVRRDIPITILNAPSGREFVTQPPVVDLIMEVQFPLKADPKKDIMVVADYDQLSKSISGKVNVKPMSLPLGVLKYEIDPVAVKIKEIKR